MSRFSVYHPQIKPWMDRIVKYESNSNFEFGLDYVQVFRMSSLNEALEWIAVKAICNKTKSMLNKTKSMHIIVFPINLP